MTDIEKKISDLIDDIRPYLINDGGDIQFVKYENNIVYIQLQGACLNCQMIDITVNDGIVALLKENIPEITDVVCIS